MGKKFLRFKTRTWFYDKTKPATEVIGLSPNLSEAYRTGGFVQVWVSPGDVVPAENVLYGATGDYQGYITGGHAELVDESELDSAAPDSSGDSATED